MTVCAMCGEETELCSCAFVGTNSIVADGSGSPTNPLALAPRISPSVGNLLSCDGDGLVAPPVDRFVNPPRARVFHSVDRLNDDFFGIHFDSERYDTHGFHSGLDNRQLVVPFRALWTVGFDLAFVPNLPDVGDPTYKTQAHVDLVVNGTQGYMMFNEVILRDGHPSYVLAEEDFVFEGGDLLTIIASAGALNFATILATPETSPEFWIQFAGDAP